MRRRDFVKGMAAVGGLSIAGNAAGDSGTEWSRLALPTGGSQSYWTTGEKYGTATVPDHGNPSSYVWFTITEGALTEARFPRADLMNLRSLDFLVVDSDSSYARRTMNTTRKDDGSETLQRTARMVESDAMVFEQTIEETGSSRSWTLDVEYALDVDGNAILADVDFSASSSRSYDVYVVVDPAASNSGLADVAERTGQQESYRLHAYDDSTNDGDAAFVDQNGDPYNVALTLDSKSGFSWASADIATGNGNDEPWATGSGMSAADKLFEGTDSDSVQEYQQSEGNVLLVGQFVADDHNGSDTIGLGFAGNQDTTASASAVTDAFSKGYGTVRSEYVTAWTDWVSNTLNVPGSVKASANGSTTLEHQYKASAMVLKVVESKRFPGASLASPSVPWGDAAKANDPADYGYNYTWSRDLYNVFTALEAMGDVEGAKLSPEYVYAYQQDDQGFVPQNTYFDGRTRWGGEQMDNVSFPQIMAYMLKERHGYDLSSAPYAYENVRKSADYVVRNGPATQQERWEEEGGVSPSTVAAEIAGLACSAKLAEDVGEHTDALVYLAVADHWQQNVENWCTTTSGVPKVNDHLNGFPELGSSEFTTPYYFRINDDTDPGDGTELDINNGGPSLDERSVVDAGFLELVRLGLKPASDTAVQNSVDIVDETIRVDTPQGPGFFRYTGDGYGEQPENDDEGAEWGAPWSLDVSSLDGGGKGRLWPIFTGERAEYELLRGTSSGPMAPSNLLETMANFANSGRMIPEQVWDRSSGSPYDWDQGEGTGSATPLAWSNAQYVRLAHAIDAGTPVETPAFTRKRYVDQGLPQSPSLSVTIPDTSNTGSATVEGSTDGDELVVRTPETTLQPTVESDGSFTAEVELQSGKNSITVVAATSGSSLAQTGTAVERGTVDNTGFGTKIATWSDDTGDGNGPGSYTRPTNAAFDPGMEIFDLTGFDVYETPTRYRFAFEFDHPLTNPFGGNGFSHQFPQVYLRDPDASGGETQAREGVDATFDGSYHKRVVATGYGFGQVENADGSVASSDVSTIALESEGVVAVDLPKSAVGELTEMELSPVVLAQDGYSTGKVRAVGESQSEYGFGGGRADDTNPNVLDLITPEGVSQADALSYSANLQATIPYLSFDSGVLNLNADAVAGDKVAAFSDPMGDDAGPGGYTYPSDGSFYDGAFDLVGVDVYETADAYKFAYRIAGKFQDSFGSGKGFSVQTLHLYFRDPDRSGGQAAAREGVNADLASNYHYRVVAEAFQSPFVEEIVTQDGSTQADRVAESGVTVAGNTDINAIVTTVPKSAIGGDIDGYEAAFFLMGQDGYGTGRIRPVQASGGQWSFGGGTDSGNDPNVIDMVTPDGTTQSQALSYSSSSKASVPLIELDLASPTSRLGNLVDSFNDDTGDDAGPGSYTYPTNSAFYSGAFDVTGFDIYEGSSEYHFVYRMAEPIQNPWGGGAGFSHQFPQVYLRKPGMSGGTTQARAGVNANFDAAYHYRVVAHGFGLAQLEDASGSVVSSNVSASVISSANAIVVSVPKSALSGSISNYEVAPLMFGQDGYDTGQIRHVNAAGGEWKFGGGTDTGNDPNVIDMVTPSGVAQADALSYSSSSKASMPYLSVGGGSGGQANPFGSPFRNAQGLPGDPDGDGLFEDINGDNQTDLIDVQTLYTERGRNFSANESSALDFNGDGSFDLLDVAKLFDMLK